MGINGVQERGTRHAVSTATFETCGIVRSRIATDDVVAAAALIVRIVDTELSVVEDVEGLRTKLDRGSFRHLEMLRQRHIEAQAVRVVEEIAAGIAEGEAARGDKLRRIEQERSKALRVAAGLWCPANDVRIRSCDTQSAGDACIIRKGNASIAGAVDDGERRPGLEDRHTGDFPAFQKTAPTGSGI